MSDDLPPEMLRGVRSEEWASNDPLYLSAFFFDDDDDRTDGYRELSIIWYYNSESLDMLRSITYNSKSIFRGGVAVIERGVLDSLIEKHNLPVKYESKPSNRLPHHGNILIRKDSSIMERRVAAYIARCATFYRLDSIIPCKNDSTGVPAPT